MKKIKLFKQAKTLYFLTGMFFAFSASSVAQTIINGSFETPDATAGNAGLPGVLSRPVTTNWVFEGNSFIMKNGCAYGPPNAVAGIQCAAIQNGGNLYQNINFDAGTYVLTFSAAQRTGNADNIPIVVSVDGTTISTLTATSTAYSSLQTASFTVTAGVHKIQLTTTQTANDCTVFLDNVIAVNILTGIWDQRPATSLSTTYNQNFSSAWDAPFDAVFQGQWTTLNPNAFGASNVSTGAINFNWSARRIMATKYLSIPYAITADIDYQNNSNRGGIVLREASGNLDNMQEPAFGDPGFNRVGIALYPYVDGSSFVVQFNGVPVANTTGNKQVKIFVPAPASTTLLSRNTIRVEDYGTSVYVFYNGNPYIRIELAGKVGTYYTSGAVYDASMNVVGVFSGMTIESFGQAAIAMRDAVLRLYSAKIEMVTSGGNMETGKPSGSFTQKYTQTFTSWTTSDRTTFSKQWDVLDNVSNLGFSTDHLKMGWTEGRVIASKVSVATPYVFESDIQVLSVGGCNGGIVVRADAANSIENFQEPGNLAILPQFNSVGIAIFASSDGAGMNIQLSEALKPANATVLHRYYIPGTVGVNYRNRGVIRVEDYGTSLYVYYAGNAFARIDLSDLVGNNYTSAMVYNNQGSLVGACSNIVVPQTGKLGLASRFGAANQSINVFSAQIQTLFVPSSNLTWTGGTNISWTDGTNWSTGIVPDQNSDVTIGTGTFQPTIATNVSINSLTINAGATLTVSGPNLTVTGVVANSGTMTLGSNSNLIQGGTTNANTGNITVKRNSNALFRSDYTIWSSPVTNIGLFLKAFSPLTVDTRFYNYNQTTNKYNAVEGPSTTPFALAAGYLIRMPNNGSTAYEAGTETLTYPGEFTGVPNNGTITKAMAFTVDGYNMVGNPYPSTIDAQAFIAANTANIESTLYFWRKTNGALGTAYATYNSLGPVAAGSGLTGTGSEAPNGTIQVGQGFFVKSKSASNLTFTNAMRVSNNDNQFFKTKAVQKDRLWLNLTTASGVFSQTLVGYTAEASQGLDIFDAKYFNDSPIALTSNINNEEYTIQGRPAFDPSDVVALNFKTDVAGDYTIALDHFDGVFAAGQDIFLKDNTTGAETNLKNSSYTFNAASGTDNTRFSLTFQKTLKVDAPAFNENSVSVHNNNGTLYVNSGLVAISNISVFDVQGRLISQQRNVKATTATIKDVRSNQVLIVKIVGEDNSEVTKKVLN